MDSLRSTLLNALDDISLLRSSHLRRQRALNQLEQILAQTCISANPFSASNLNTFLELQNAFDCNIASRLLAYISQCLPSLQNATHIEDTSEDSDIGRLQTSIAHALGILQGVALIHTPSKAYLGRKWVVELFLTLLTASRDSPVQEPSSPTKSPRKKASRQPLPPPSLATVVVDTLLCVLVDAPAAVRVFEEVDGLETVVKTLKREGAPRDVRMKCLEFLYWYLLPEEGLPQEQRPVQDPHEIPLPRSPVKLRFPTPGPVQPTLSWSSTSSSSSSEGPVTPPRSPTKAKYAMLKRDLDFVPTTPKKNPASRLGLGTPMTADAKPFSLLRSPTKRPAELDRSLKALSRESSACENRPLGLSPRPPRMTKTTAEKKEILGSLLGNVDVLVEGVAQAGVWSLG